MKRYGYYIGGVALIVGAFLLISWRRRVANAAAEFIDQQEIGTNQGFADKAFQKMLSEVGWSSGESWCMYFVKAVYLGAFPKRADKINSILNPSTQRSWKNAINNPDVFKVITDGKPQKGDIVIWQSTKNQALGHSGIVLSKGKDENKYYVVEGNSDLGGSRDGDGVVKAYRTLVPGTVQGTLKVLGFLRLKTF